MPVGASVLTGIDPDDWPSDNGGGRWLHGGPDSFRRDLISLALRTVLIFVIAVPPLYLLYDHVRAIDWGDEVPNFVLWTVGGPKTVAYVSGLTRAQLFVYVVEDVASSVIPVYVVFVLLGLWKVWRMR